MKIFGLMFIFQLLIFPVKSFAGIAFCVFPNEHKASDKIHIYIDPLLTSHELNKKLRRDIRDKYVSKRSPSCESPSDYEFKPGEYNYAIGRLDRIIYDGTKRTTFSIGFGKTDADARIDLEKNIDRQEWDWNKKKNPYRVIETGIFRQVDKKSACYRLAKYRDNELVEDLDENNKILMWASDQIGLYEEIKNSLESDKSEYNVKRIQDLIATSTNTLTDLLQTLVPAPKPLNPVIVIANRVEEGVEVYKSRDRDEDITKDLAREVSVVGKKLSEILMGNHRETAWFIKGKTASLEQSLNIIRIKENQKDWEQIIDQKAEEIDQIRTKLVEFRDTLENSEERIEAINSYKNFIDQHCG